jgi:FkbM family methyltransferase
VVRRFHACCLIIMLARLITLCRYLRFRLGGVPRDWATHFASLRMPLPILDSLGIASCYEGRVRVNAANAWLISNPHLSDLVALAGVTFSFAADSRTLFAHTPGFTISITSAEEVYILWEILVLKSYNMAIGSEPIVIDVGMNVGISALAFAANSGCIVYGYEPVPETYQLASANISRNFHLSNRIIVHNIGLSDRNGRVSVEVDSSRRGRTGLVPLSQREQGATVKLVDIELRDAASVYSSIRASHPDALIYIKLDCEGAEFSVLRRLADARLLPDVAGIMAEWHHFTANDKIESITQALAVAGHRTVCLSNPDGISGMLYSIRLQSRRDSANQA